MKNTKIKNQSFHRRKRIPNIISSMILILVFCYMFAFPVLAEGSSATVSLALSRATLNIGKTFTLTLRVASNTGFPIASFDATLQYDTSKFELIMENGSPKITRPTGVPASFQMDASASGGQITTICADGTTAQNAPIQTNGETSLISFTFKVKDSASIGDTSFQIIDCTVTRLENLNPISVPLTIVSPKTASIASRLDTNTYLSEIKTSVGTLSPAFSKSVVDYLLEVPVATTAVTVTAKQESSLSKIAIAGGSDLAYGDNKVTITVTAQDPDAVRVYTVIVRRASPPVSSSETSSVSEVSEVSESTSSEESSEEISASESSSESFPVSDPAQAALQFWKLIAFLFIGLFVVTGGVMVWLLIDKLGRNGNQIRRIDNDIQNDLGSRPVDDNGMDSAMTHKAEKVKIKKVKIKRIK